MRAVLYGLAWLLPGVVLAGFLWLAVLPELAGGVATWLLALGLLPYGLLALMHRRVADAGRARTAALDNLASCTAAQQELSQALRMRVDPQFLCDGLEAIGAALPHDPGAARELALQLAGFCHQRQALAAQRAVPLAQEMALVRRFLAIEKGRRGERLVTEEALEKGALACLVPPLIVQALVESLLRDADDAGGAPEGVLLLVAAWREQGRLRMTVSLSGSSGGSISGRSGGGLAGSAGADAGVADARRRLARIFPGSATLAAKCEDGTHTVDIALPLEPAAQ